MEARDRSVRWRRNGITRGSQGGAAGGWGWPAAAGTRPALLPQRVQGREGIGVGRGRVARQRGGWGAGAPLCVGRQGEVGLGWGGLRPSGEKEGWAVTPGER